MRIPRLLPIRQGSFALNVCLSKVYVHSASSCPFVVFYAVHQSSSDQGYGNVAGGDSSEDRFWNAWRSLDEWDWQGRVKLGAYTADVGKWPDRGLWEEVRNFSIFRMKGVCAEPCRNILQIWFPHGCIFDMAYTNLYLFFSVAVSIKILVCAKRRVWPIVQGTTFSYANWFCSRLGS